MLGNNFSELLYEIAPFVGPRMDVYKTKVNFFISVDIAGARLEDLSLKLKTYTLIIEGTIKNIYTQENTKVICSERFYGTFKRKVLVPMDCILDQLQAVYEKGVLLIKIPLFNETKQNQSIDINIQGE